MYTDERESRCTQRCWVAPDRGCRLEGEKEMTTRRRLPGMSGPAQLFCCFVMQGHPALADEPLAMLTADKPPPPALRPDPRGDTRRGMWRGFQARWRRHRDIRFGSWPTVPHRCLHSLRSHERRLLDALATRSDRPPARFRCWASNHHWPRFMRQPNNGEHIASHPRDIETLSLSVFLSLKELCTHLAAILIIFNMEYSYTEGMIVYGQMQLT